MVIDDIRFETRGEWDQGIVKEVVLFDTYGLQDLHKEGMQISQIVDVGAHIGGFSLFANKLWPFAQILAFEPDPDNFKLLRENITGNVAYNITPVQAALTDGISGEMDLNVMPNKATENTGASSLFIEPTGSTVVRVKTLDATRALTAAGFTDVDILKLDCEASEAPILENLFRSGLLQHCPFIVGEWHGQAQLDRVVAIMNHAAKSSWHSTAPGIGLFAARFDVAARRETLNSLLGV
jgi:FkbM family methyltransferase